MHNKFSARFWKMLMRKAYNIDSNSQIQQKRPPKHIHKKAANSQKP